MERIEEFSIEGKDFVYLDLSGMSTNNEFSAITEALKATVAKYPEDSLYTITNIGGIRFDSEMKYYLTDCISHNKPYVKHGVMIGFDGIKKSMVSSVCEMFGRSNMHFAFTKERAIEWLLEQD